MRTLTGEHNQALTALIYAGSVPTSWIPSVYQGLAAGHRRFSDGALPKEGRCVRTVQRPEGGHTNDVSGSASCVLTARVTYERLTPSKALG